ncbi:hypothetical protein QP164_14425 [Sphingomonas sp. LR59]|uniref:hypothetical protein n=1 Tax=Sphingomonas sp. LR59 TaxID=3050232 RepID=UPI002FE23A99
MILLPALLTASCATTPSADLSGFGRAATGLQADVGTTFTEANRIARSVEVDRFVRSGAIGLSERRFLRPFHARSPPAGGRRLGILRATATCWRR